MIRAACLGAVALSTASALLLLGGGAGRADPGVVAVLVSGSGAVPDVATGFLAAGGERVVTVAHVLDSGGAVAVRGADGARHPARVLRVDRADDLAVLALDEAVAAVRAPPGGGTRLLGVGEGSRPRVMPAAVRRRISARIRDSASPAVYTREAIELDASVTSGDSGAPVVDGDGRLLGVLFAASHGRPGVAYAVDAVAVDRLLGGARQAVRTE